MKYVWALSAALFIFLFTTYTNKLAYNHGFRNGTSEAYSHIDDNDPRCK